MYSEPTKAVTSTAAEQNASVQRLEGRNTRHRVVARERKWAKSCMKWFHICTMDMQLAEWLVRWAPELVSRVPRSAGPSFMMHTIHSYKNLSCNYVSLKIYIY